LILVSQDDVRIAAATNVACLQVFRLDNLDCEDISSGLADLLKLWWSISRDNLGAPVDIDVVFKLVKLGKCILDIVQFY
jgi:hypothetical protein